MAILPNINGIGTAPTLIWNPSSNRENQTITNIGLSTLYLGGAGVDPGNGLPFPPGSQAELVRNSGSLYACTGPGAPVAGGGSTTLSAAVASGVTTVPATSATNFATGDTVVIGSGSDAETRKITVASLNFSFTPALSYDHAATDTIVEVAVPGQGAVSVSVGVQ
jgi:hypothetical protein